MNQSNKFSFNPKEAGLLEHLGELRSRLIWSALAFLVFTIASFSYTEEAFRILTKPFFEVFPANALIGTGPAEAFVLKLKISVFFGILLAFPVIAYHVWAFVAPGLYDAEKRMALPLAIATTVAFGSGVVFAYEAVFPVMFPFFLSQYNSIGVTPQIRISEHLALMLQGMLAFGIVFETPVAAYLAGRLGIITHQTLIDWGRYAIVAIFLISAVLTPPDVVSQMLMAIPMLALYGLSIVILKISGSPKTEDKNEQTPE
jgi:sec-independent protein translocase protein TatC